MTEAEWRQLLADRDARITEQDALILALREQIAALDATVQELRARLNADSTKSNRPPSSDGLKKPKPKSLRKPSGKRVGGQLGHPGSSLSCMDPKTIIEHRPDASCDACGTVLPEPQMVEARQVIDLPPIALEATEHRLFEVRCGCGKVCRPSWPPHVEARVQYGPRIRALAVHLTQHHMLPIDRCSTILEDLCGASISGATLQHACIDAAKQVEPVVKEIGEALSQAAVAHADETGFRVEKRLHWLHTVCTSTLTFIHGHAKRGYEAMEDGGVLSKFHGILIHDCWKPYWRLACEHALCNAHIVRELTALQEDYGQPWAGKLKTILLEALSEAKANDEAVLAPERLHHYQHRASIQIGYGKRDNPEQRTMNGKRKGKQSVARNLLERLQRLKNEVWRFASDARVAFTNNTAEQAIRMPKVKQKVSGCFRTLAGAQRFCTIRSYLDTMRKQGRNPLEALTQALQGTPLRPDLTTTAV
jgi:transposase